MEQHNHSFPLLTYDFIEYMSQKKLDDKILVEIGSGESALYWETKFKKVISYENDHFFYEKILKIKSKESTEIKLFDKTIFYSNDFLSDVRKADYIIIDNSPVFISRYDFSVFCKKNMKLGCSIVLDNGTWNLEAYSYLSNEFFVKDFPGKNKNSELTVTSIFEKPRELKYYEPTIEE